MLVFGLAACDNNPNTGSGSENNMGTDGGTEDSEYLSFALNVDGTEYAVSGTTGNPVDIEIPATFDNLPVTSIAEKAFYQCTTIESIVMSDSIASIGEYCFAECTNLTDVTFGKGLVTIGEHAFEK